MQSVPKVSSLIPVYDQDVLVATLYMSITGRGLYPSTLVSSTNKTDGHYRTEILLNLHTFYVQSTFCGKYFKSPQKCFYLHTGKSD
jgi:hypothetical protein